ncbi:amino acid/amide ABC transporter substrate-binding protein (HAAT family) [Archangium gephyra]|uniref:Amino acid/amide ABC transporter substrate-binding protein (HAAT family) n=1 Tax=Archangium gephyra TaxID=48 RepID=A0AAC8Q5B6_9BACT|nr:ABC transporter substrate-binding protein [Archangium gephyra]AKJ00909.1 Branched-chain amino acid ABC transporter, amino acid-binding protein [Archangium gephyra]REG26077.1 amino acid/amide ABC transporter substrate-binding protein (HAAT family) [Archangium gephyra]
MRALFLTGVMSVLAAGCSLTTAAGLDECETSADCQSDQVCTQRVCLPLPAGCRAEPYGSTDADAVRMGGLFPLHTSPEAGASEDESDVQGFNAALLALEEVNQRTLGGRKIALYFCDTGSSRDVAKKQAQWLVNDKKVAAVLTAGSSQTLGVADVTIPAGVLTMSYSASSTELTVKEDTNGGPVGLLWRTSPSDAIQGSVIAHLLRTRSDLFGGTTPSKVGILYVEDPYGQGLSNIISEQLSTGSARIPNRTFLYQRGSDVKPVLDSLDMTYGPTVTVLIGFADDATAILREASTRTNLKRESGHHWFFSDSVKDAAVLADTLAASQARGFYGTAPAQGTGQAFSTFSARFNDKYKKDPAAYAYTSNAYDAMYLLALGASYSLSTSNAVTGAKMAEALTRVSSGTSSTSTQLTNSNFTYLAAELAAGRGVNIEGASGPLNFDANGEARAPVELWQVGDSGFVTISSNLEPPP